MLLGCWACVTMPHAHLSVLRIMSSELGKPPWARLTRATGLSIRFILGRQAGRQAAPTCYMDRNKDHRIFLDRSNSFLHPSCPYWFGPFPPRCVPVALIKQQVIYPPQNESRCQENKGGRKERTKKRRQNFRQSLWQKETQKKGGGKKKNGRHHIRKILLPHRSVPTCYMDIWKGHSISLNLLNFSRPPSCLGWYGSCHLQHDRVVLVRTKGWQQWNEFYWLLFYKNIWEMSTSELDAKLFNASRGDACIRMNLHMQKKS